MREERNQYRVERGRTAHIQAGLSQGPLSVWADALRVPVFSPPPLKFRTAGFPQYGFKQEFNRDLRHDAGLAPQLIRG